MSKLNEPLTFPNGTTVANRFVMPPMLTNSGSNGFATQDTIDYYQAHAKSGGMVITEYTYVSENGGPALTWKTGREQIASYDDKFIPQLTKVATAIKSSGNRAIMQIAHTGREANFRAIEDKPVYAPSEVDFPFLPYKVHELSDEQVKQIVADFGAAAKRAIEAGFDGVEIHGANHYLIQQFFSAYSNRRNDHWGGSLEKRMNFPLAVVKSVMETVKKYAPKGFIVGYRISPEEIHGKNVGYTWHEATKLVDRLTKKFDLDYIHLSMPHYDAKPGDAMLGDASGNAAEKSAGDQTLAELFHPVLNGAKEIIVGNVRTKEDAEAASQLADLVAAGRATIIDPLFADKILNGHEDEVVHEITIDQTKKAKMTPGLIETFSADKLALDFPGSDNIRPLHKQPGAWTEIQYPNNAQMK